MDGPPDVLAAFVDAFNRHDDSALCALLADDATARVLGAPFPEERGAQAIGNTSLPYLLDPKGHLGASVAEVEGAPGILLRAEDGEGPIDTAIRIETNADRICCLEYIVAPHEPSRLLAIGAALNLPTAAD